MDLASSVPDLKLGRLILYHWKDWVLIGILIGIDLLCQLVTPFKRYVGAPNFATQFIIYPYKHNTIPFSLVPVRIETKQPFLSRHVHP